MGTTMWIWNVVLCLFREPQLDFLFFSTLLITFGTSLLGMPLLQIYQSVLCCQELHPESCRPSWALEDERACKDIPAVEIGVMDLTSTLSRNGALGTLEASPYSPSQRPRFEL
jgi:hypothetical protein